MADESLSPMDIDGGVVDFEEHDEGELDKGGVRRKYMPLRDVYSASFACGSGSRQSRKGKAVVREPGVSNGDDQLELVEHELVEDAGQVYSRRRKKAEGKRAALGQDVLPDVELVEMEEEPEQIEEEECVKRRRVGSSAGEMMDVGVDGKELKKSEPLNKSDGKKVSGKKRNVNGDVNDSGSGKQKNASANKISENSVAFKTKKWVRLSYEGADPEKFVGSRCKVYWPLDANWYPGHIVAYNSGMKRHRVKYDDEEEEDLILSNEQIKFHISFEEMQRLNLKCCEKSSEVDGLDIDEMMALAALLNDGPEIEPGNVIWAKLTGHAIWPAIVLDNPHGAQRKGLNKVSGDKSVSVQFFGTHDFARVSHKNVHSFVVGCLQSYHLKCKKPTFRRGLEEAKMYLSELKLPKKMLLQRDGIRAGCSDGGNMEQESCADLDDEECVNHDDIRTKLEDLKSCPLEEGELQVISLGKIVEDSDNFQNDRFIWPVGYTAVRKFPSVTDPRVSILYKMEVLRDVNLRTRPLFRVMTENGDEFTGSTPNACWNKIYERIKTVQTSNRDYRADVDFESGPHMFGFSDQKVSKLIKEMSSSRRSLKSSDRASKRPKGKFEFVDIEWKDLDKCNVCHMDEEYENNLFLQCDKCRMMVHAKCYGELEPTGGALWLCNLCRPGAPISPKCCLCPITGGAMKPTTDGRWAHLACAIWIPETCLSDIKKMEPIDGVQRVHKDRWKLTCIICDVPYGACIQCSNNTCRVAFHPLCARAAGFCLEPADVDKLHLVSFDEDKEDQCIQLLSFCRKHRPSSNDRLASDKIRVQKARESAEVIPRENPYGCARAEPYQSWRARTTPLTKRLYLENIPHIIGGMSPHNPLWNKSSSNSIDLQKLRTSQLPTTSEIHSIADKYNYMKQTLKKRLVHGKSAIHGFGVFTKVPHRAGDMIIEYTGEIIRPRVADRREHLIYNSLVGAGTYMFRIDDERVIDATKAGSIAHLINHSCEPNCYSRAIKINGEDHIIIFSKRDLKVWEELTYDYRFVSSDERLACYCGSSRCRGVVNDVDAEERLKPLYVPRSELIEWKGEE